MLLFLFAVLTATDLAKGHTDCRENSIANQTFNLQNCQLLELNLGDSRTSLEKVHAQENLLQNLNDSNFKGAKNLTEIDVSFNQIEKFPVVHLWIKKNW